MNDSRDSSAVPSKDEVARGDVNDAASEIYLEAIAHSKGRLLIVDDDSSFCDEMSEGLRKFGHECVTVSSVAEAKAYLDSGAAVDLVFSALQLDPEPEMELLRYLQNRYPRAAVVVMASRDEHERVVEALRNGADDILLKPFRPEDGYVCAWRTLEKRRVALERAAVSQTVAPAAVSQPVTPRVRRSQRMLTSTVESFVLALHMRDAYTAQHSERVAILSALLAKALHLSAQGVERVRVAALLHDIGKLGIRENILQKNGKLAPDEFDHIKTHPLLAETILQPIKALRPLIPIVKHEHEAFDGSGYPDGLRGEEIPLEARIIAIADAYDALTTDRPYRKALSTAEAFAILKQGAGTQWDPKLVWAFTQLYKRGKIVASKTRDGLPLARRSAQRRAYVSRTGRRSPPRSSPNRS
jgi:putative two-component system response regulator